ncbi:MAG: hypothetical protein KGJ13_10175 [Patescibacteria group bacterium]|nr:hypothetical protein [Patescibacteria group bacterium]
MSEIRLLNTDNVKIHRELVELLETLLAEAKNGDIQGIVGYAKHKNGDFETYNSGMMSRTECAGGISMAYYAFMQRILE